MISTELVSDPSSSLVRLEEIRFLDPDATGVGERFLFGALDTDSVLLLCSCSACLTNGGQIHLRFFSLHLVHLLSRFGRLSSTLHSTPSLESRHCLHFSSFPLVDYQTKVDQLSL